MILIFLVIFVKYSPTMSTVPVMYQVSSIDWPLYFSHPHDNSIKKIKQTFSSSLYYSRVEGVYTKLEAKVMDAPVFQKLDLFTGKTEQIFLFRKDGGKMFALNNGNERRCCSLPPLGGRLETTLVATISVFFLFSPVVYFSLKRTARIK